MCGIADVNTRLCAVAKCQQFYHVNCVRSLPLTQISDGSRFKCPHHACATCAADDSSNPAVRQGNIIHRVPWHLLLCLFVCVMFKKTCDIYLLLVATLTLSDHVPDLSSCSSNLGIASIYVYVQNRRCMIHCHHYE